MKILAMMEDTPTFSGGRIAFINLLKTIEDDVQLTFITTTGATMKAQVEIFREIRYWVPKKGKVLYYFKFLLKLLLHGLKNHFDIIFCNAGMTTFVGIVLARIRRKKLIILSHDCFTPGQMIRLVKGPIKKLTGLIRVFYMMAPLRFSDLILTVSPTTKKDLEEYYGLSHVQFLGNVVQL